MRYISTRGGAEPRRFAQILLEGLAPDGGLYLPETYPQADLAAWRGLGYVDLAFEILSRFVDDIPPAELRALIAASYTPAIFGDPAITPVLTLAPDLHLLRLSNGPTLAFKDIAMQLLGPLFQWTGETLNILGATSGDTGSAAEHAMRGRPKIQVFMLSPQGRMSAFQRAQMYGLQDKNIFNIAVDGNFDECQAIVKAISNDLAFKKQHRIGAVNSINWARLLAQVVYYFKGYFAVTRRDDEVVDFAVPSGNFGNVCAGHIARSMGLPIRRLIVATNENDVLDEFFRTGRYRPRTAAETHVTSSPSMDISKASNFERFVYDLVGRDPVTLGDLWAEVDAGAGFDLSTTPFFDRLPAFGFASGRSTHADRLTTIRRVWADYQVEIDPHTADGVKVALEQRTDGVPILCLETALPAKFEETMVEALGRKPTRPPGYEGIEDLPQRVTEMPADVARVRAFIEATQGS